MEDNLAAFNELVLLKYQVFNSIFLTLELDGVHRTGILLPLLQSHCQKGFEKSETPDEIINSFFEEWTDLDTEKKRNDQLFRFIQYIEREVVLVDSLEDAAFDRVNNLNGSGSFNSFYETVKKRRATDEMLEALKHFRVRLVLTAHPTQFYPGAVLGIITDLGEAIKANNLLAIKEYLTQLGKTPFFKKEKPTPYDEAVNLIWFLENIFYHAIPKIVNSIGVQLHQSTTALFEDNTLLQLGFWPGGDRDGNPFVKTDTTLKVAERMRTTLMKSYYRDIRKLKRHITFKGSEDKVLEIEQKLYEASFVNPKNAAIKLSWLKKALDNLHDDVEKNHQSLFIDDINELREKVKIFGFHFSSIGLRQDSRVIKSAFEAFKKFIPEWKTNKNLDTDFEALLKLAPAKQLPEVKDPVLNDTFQCIPAMKEIQKRNGAHGCYRFIISNCRDENDVARIFGMARFMGLGEKMFLDVIPLFETIDDLAVADAVMEKLYANATYMNHLKNRKKKQVIMLGFSDGTKDGGYLTANWSIYKAKETITSVSRKYGIKVVFFDGRGGPPARGGGNTHKFYASLGPTIDSSQIQLTIQGQTISSKFGTVDSARFNMEQLLTAGLENQVLNDPDKKLTEEERKVLEELSKVSYKAYQDFKKHPKFVPYLEEMSTLKYYGMTNISSRPTKRGKDDKLKFEDLRAIPFVGAWSQLKQNVPGFYGVGKAIAHFDSQGKLDEIKKLYQNSLFFRTLIENSMQSLSKSYFPLTRYMRNDKEFGKFWTLIYSESVQAKKYLLEISGQKELLQTNPAIKASIELRESIVLPLLTIQQFALIKIKELEKSGKGTTELAESYRKLVIRSLYGNINASRNSA
ncbi:phosphoenolpyruvate carboxylase [Cryomorpha ignava]|uniref:Phosphoenolpyruvate carboxylase n=1 Tax=Cryomorpha ignava TaxID=101383 RepID=A0A7K3WTV8_9FLAO|nr:phosphoenolpyruvate carboxylase [Cryomorpha ignava]NEN25123.1 phosphoenolpyruvate carboxylase [Cryomorpha ignava]